MNELHFSDAPRIQNSVFSRIEAQLLGWFAARIPKCINSDHLTALGFAAMMGACTAYVLSEHDKRFLHLVNVFVLLNWLGDSLDGTLARYRNRLRPRYGFYVDHILDTFSMLLLIGGLAMSRYMSLSVAGVLLVIYFMLCINVYLATYTLGTFRISFGKFSPTEMRLLLAIGNLVLLHRPVVHLLGSQFLLFDVGGTVAAALMGFVLISSTVLNIQFLYRLERLT